MTAIAKAEAFAEQAAGPTRIGLGCMALTGIYGAIGIKRARATLHQALDLGIRLFDTAALYGNGANETMLGDVLGGRNDVFITTKFGLREEGRKGKLVCNSRPEAIRRSVEASLSRLHRERIDLLLQHRPDPETSDDILAETADRLLQEGKIAAFGLSAATTDRLGSFPTKVKVSAVQNELSLAASGDPSEPAAAARCGAMFMAYAPLGRGILTGRSIARDFAADDLRSGMARYDPRHVEADGRLLDTLDAVARGYGATRAAVALAWTVSAASNVVALPGARSPSHVAELLEATRLALTVEDNSKLREAHDRRRQSPFGIVVSTSQSP